MSYSNSTLVSYKKISPKKTKGRTHVIDTITVHCMAGNLSVESCGEVFQNKKASSNYGIGSDGRIALYVDEKDRSWATSNSANDDRAITIEVANDGDAKTGWHSSNKAMNALVELCADICKRNKIKKLVWSNKKSDRKKHLNGCNMTVHRDYALKSCPGDYIYSQLPIIAQKVNEKLLTNSSVKDRLKAWELVFNPSYYYSKYADLRNAGLKTDEQLLNHFVTCGIDEGRQGSATFNPQIYKERYRDLQASFGNTMRLYYLHYIQVGKNEGRSGI